MKNLRRRIITQTACAVVRRAGTQGGDRLWRRVDALSRLLHNDSSNITINGELWLLSTVGAGALTVFDVGANAGAWTATALDQIPRGVVHAFEPVPETFHRLEKSLGRNERVRLNQSALTDRASGELRFWTDGRDGTMASATGPPGESGREIVVPCTSGDAYMESHQVEHIDFLKIDVEGHEMHVLNGFKLALASGAVDLVQFEFTLWAAVARRWLADYYEFFGDLDFAVGKLWPRSVRWKAYEPEDEEFLRCNFVAVRRSSVPAHLLGATGT